MDNELLHSPVLWVIIGCEIGFWALVLSGLCVRYLVRRRRLSSALLLGVPLVDVILVAAVALDLARGAEVTTVHRLAGVYLGLTVAFGHSIIAWADAHFAYRFAGGPRPPRPPKTGPAAFRHEVRSFARWLLAAAVTSVTVLALSVTVADDQQAADLRGVFGMLGIVTVIWLVTGPVWSSVSAGDDDRDERGRPAGHRESIGTPYPSTPDAESPRADHDGTPNATSSHPAPNTPRTR